MSRLFSVIRDRWQSETDGAGLALVRMLVAASVLLEMLQVWVSDGVTDLLVDLHFHFKYTLFHWVGPPQGMMPAVFVWALAIVSVMVLIGWRTRWTASLMAAGYIYWFLIDAANYSDHGYLVCLMSILVAWLPTARWASVDAYIGREKTTQVPAWCVELVRVQLALVNFFFALSMLNSDWLAGSPLIAWAEVRADSPAAAYLTGKPDLAKLISWSVPTLYLVAIPALWWKWSRPVALVGLALFHLWDAYAFNLSVSPWLLTGLSLVFCDSARCRGWIDAAFHAIPNWPALQLPWRILCGLGLVIDRCVSWFDDTPLVGDGKAKPRVAAEPDRPVTPPSIFPTPARYLVAVWLLLQCWLPVRYVTIESQPDWTDMASMFAWRGQHRDKQCDLRLSVIQPNRELRWPLFPEEEFPVPLAIFYADGELDKKGLSEGTLKDLASAPELTRAARFAAFKISKAEGERIVARQLATSRLALSAHQHEQMSQRPEFVRQYAHYVGAALTGLLDEDVQVHAELNGQLNFRAPQLMLSEAEEFDLTRIDSPIKLAERLPKLAERLPAVSDQIVVAKELAERRRIELEEDYDIVLDKNRGKGEPTKVPVLSDEDERWFQEKFVKNK